MYIFQFIYNTSYRSNRYNVLQCSGYEIDVPNEAAPFIHKTKDYRSLFRFVPVFFQVLACSMFFVTMIHTTRLCEPPYVSCIFDDFKIN